MSPAVVLGWVLASCYGLAFYALFGRGWWRLVGYYLASVCGFFLGHTLAGLGGLGLFDIGELHAVEGTLVSWLSCTTMHVWRRK